MTHDDILAALRLRADAETARVAYDNAVAAAQEGNALLLDNGIVDAEGELTETGNAVIALMRELDEANATPARGTVRGTAANWAVRTKLTDEELHEWILEALRKDPKAGWAKLKAAYETAGYASGWPRFKEAYGDAKAALAEETAAQAS